MADLCEQLGIPRRTFNQWVQDRPEIAVVRNGRGGPEYWIKVEKLGLDLVDAHSLLGARWVRAAHLAKVSGISRWTIQNWCRERPGFGKRIGRSYWVDLDQLGVSEQEIERLLGELVKFRRGSRAGM